MPHLLSLGSLRLSLLAAAGLGVAACGNSSTTATASGHGGAGSSASSTGGAAGASQGSGGAMTVSSSSGSGGAGGAGGTGGTGGALGPGDAVCAGAKPLMATNGMPTGFAQCPDGTIHRNEVVACDATIDAPTCTGTEQTVSCTSDADCTMGPHGKCASVELLDDTGLTTLCGCFYACANDAECGTGNVCVCGGVLETDNDWSLCAPAACGTGDDCESGNCAITMYTDNCSVDVNLGCRTPADACHIDDDCASVDGPYRRCVLTNAAAWACEASTCILGRPLLVDGQARTAPAVERGDWSAAVTPDLSGLDAAARTVEAERWLTAAALEHASVASFARFTLELLALGAPAALVAAAQRAGLDEVEHARVAYGLASAYAGRNFGPGPLDLGALRVSTDRREVLRSLIDEACVGETLGVVEALALAEDAVDPVLQRIHRRIAADEQRHAELAWRTLAWLLDGADQATRSFASRCFDDAVASVERASAPVSASLGAARRQAIREVVLPCAAAVLSVGPGREPSVVQPASPT